MKHRASPDFWKRCRRLPAEVQRLADESHALMLRDERHPSLRLKRVGRWWSVRVGAHAEYDRLLGR